MTEPMTEPSPLLDPSRVFARRIARIAFGFVLLAGMLALVAAFVSEALPGHRQSSALNAAQIIGYAWFAAAIVGAAAWVLAEALRLPLRPDALFVPSLTIPVAGVALILPLTLHLLFHLVLSAPLDAFLSAITESNLEGIETFNVWVAFSLMITGATHVVFAVLCVKRVYQLASGRAAITPSRIFVTTVAVSCVPFVLLFLIPPVLVAITLLPILPLLYRMQRVVDRERGELVLLPGRLPRAAAILPRRRG